MNTVEDVKALRLLCARCERIAEVVWCWSRQAWDETALWVRCHRDALVVISGQRVKSAFVATRPIELVDLQDISESAEDMFQSAEAEMALWAERADMLQKFLKAGGG